MTESSQKICPLYFILPDMALPSSKQSHGINETVLIIRPIRNIVAIQRDHLRGAHSIQIVDTDIAAGPLDTENAVLARLTLADI